MSYDLHIATRIEPTEEQVRALLGRQEELTVRGGLGAHANLLVEQVTPAGVIPLFTIDGGPAEADDLMLELAASIKSPRWSGMISIPYSGAPAAARIALSVALSIAERYRGVVFDPQTAEVILPRGGRKPPPRIKEERVSVVEVEWFFPISRLAGETPRVLLEILRRTVPDAAPRRFEGTRLADGMEQFCALWEKEASSSHDPHLWSWTGVWPSYLSLVMFRRETERGHLDALPAWNLSIPIDLRPVAADAGLRTAVIDLFVSMASTLGAFYAASYVVRGEIAIGHELYSDNETESSSVYLWEGLPDFPTWLTWFGESYRHEVTEALREFPVEEYANGIFLQIGDKPLNRDELRDRFPRLPPRLFASAPPTERYLPDLSF